MWNTHTHVTHTKLVLTMFPQDTQFRQTVLSAGKNSQTLVPVGPLLLEENR